MPVVLFLMMVIGGNARLAAQPLITLPAGTPLRLAVDRTLSSATVRPGDPVGFLVMESLILNGVVVISKGATVSGTVVAAEPAGQDKKGGVIRVKIKNLELPSGVRVTLGLVSPSKTPPAAPATTTAGILATPITGGGNSTYSVYSPKAEAYLVRGFQLTAYVQKNLTLDAGKLNQTAPQVVRTLTNDDVIAMSQAGQSEDQIVASIQSSTGQYRLEMQDIAALKKAGLTSRIIEAMMARNAAK
jgi:hypothetical protein